MIYDIAVHHKGQNRLLHQMRSSVRKHIWRRYTTIKHSMTTDKLEQKSVC